MNRQLYLSYKRPPAVQEARQQAFASYGKCIFFINALEFHVITYAMLLQFMITPDADKKNPQQKWDNIQTEHWGRLLKKSFGQLLSEIEKNQKKAGDNNAVLDFLKPAKEKRNHLIHQYFLSTIVNIENESFLKKMRNDLEDSVGYFLDVSDKLDQKTAIIEKKFGLNITLSSLQSSSSGNQVWF